MIHEDLILTAAHCATGNSSNRVYVGVYYTLVGLYREVVSQSVHPLFGSSNLGYDFMVMKLDRAVRNESITPVKLNKNSNYPANYDNLTVIGMGVENVTTSVNSPVLKEAQVQAFPNTRCAEMYGDEWSSGETMLCAGSELGGVDSCRGDSGGPILDSEQVQVGVVSFGRGCGEKLWPGVYARISGAIDWINEQICLLADRPPHWCFEGETKLEAVLQFSEADNLALNETLLSHIFHYQTNTTNITDEAKPHNLTEIKEVTDSTNNLPTSINATSIQEQTFSLRIDVMFDLYARETSWTLQKSDSREIIGHLEPYTMREPGLVSTVVDGILPGNYTFRITDTAKDGICCGVYGNGYVDIYLLNLPGQNSTEEVLVWHQRGDFGAEAETLFHLPLSGIDETVTANNDTATLQSANGRGSAP